MEYNLPHHRNHTQTYRGVSLGQALGSAAINSVWRSPVKLWRRNGRQSPPKLLPPPEQAITWWDTHLPSPSASLPLDRWWSGEVPHGWARNPAYATAGVVVASSTASLMAVPRRTRMMRIACDELFLPARVLIGRRTLYSGSKRTHDAGTVWFLLHGNLYLINCCLQTVSFAA